MKKPQSRLKMLSEGAGAVIDKVFDNPFKKIGLTWFTLRKLKYFSKKGLNSVELFGKETFFYNRFEYLYGLEEIFIDEIYLQNLPQNAYIIDCGAHIGLSVIYIKRLCPSAEIIAFEPDRTNFNVLKKNIESHSLANVHLRNEAVWNENTTLNFVEGGDMSSKVATNENSSVKVTAVRLKDFLARKVDFLKLDIEGAEFAVIKDIQDQLGMVQNFFIEYHGSFEQNRELNEIFEIITNAAFFYYIKEATPVYTHPFSRTDNTKSFDVQLNIFCFRQ